MKANLLQAIRDALFVEMARDERVLMLGMDVGRLGGVFRVTEGLQERFGASRVVDLPLAEGAIVGAALGLSASGLRPVVELQFLGFGHQAFHQIGQQVTRFRQRSQGRLAAALTIRAPYGGGVRAPEFHSDGYEGHYAHCPGLRVVAPSSPEEAKGLLLAAMRHPDPVMFLESLRGYRSWEGDVPEGDYVVPLDQARLVGDKDADVLLVGYGPTVRTALDARDHLAEEGVDASVLDLRSINPLDVDGLCRAVEHTGRVVVVSEGPVSGGVAAEVAATVQEEMFWSLESQVVRVGTPDVPHPLGAVEDYAIPDVAAVVAAARRTLESS
jgi:pyruvate dehydrogenase E1 component beta subunit